DNRIWDSQLASLSDKFRVIAPDLPGFGQSKSTKPFTMQSLADDLHSLLSQTSALPCILAGLSMGGYMTFAYAAKYAKDLKALILVDTKADADTPDGKAGRDKMIQTARTSGSPAIAAMRDRADSRPLLPSINIPTLILVGDQDPITPPAVAETMNKEIKNSKLITIKSAAHLTSMEQP